MQSKQKTIFNFRATMLSGLFVLIPLCITVFILDLLYEWTAGILAEWIKYVFKSSFENEFYIALVAIVLLGVITYSIGIIARLVAGRKMIGLFETLVMKIPLVKSIYSASKQVVDSISMPSNSAFKAVVLVEWPKPGMYAVGFLTGNMAGPKGNNLYKVFIPTTPNPTSGFLNILPPEDVIITTMKTEDAFKMIMSGGIISPESFEEAGELISGQGCEAKVVEAGVEKAAI